MYYILQKYFSNNVCRNAEKAGRIDEIRPVVRKYGPGEIPAIFVQIVQK